MFGPPGIIYVYFTYVMHWMLNISTREKGYPAAILIRGAVPVSVTRGQLRRGKEISGPARLTKALSIDKNLSGMKLGRKASLWIEESEIKIPKKDILRTPRIGIASSGLIWSQKPWRFILKKNG